MKFKESNKNKKTLISQWLNDLKSSNNEKIGEALINLSLENYPAIKEIALNYANSSSHFVRFASTYALAVQGDYNYVISLVDYITDENKYIRKISINTLNSLFPEKIIIYDYDDIEKLKNELGNIKEKIKNMRSKVRWEKEKNAFTF